MALSNELEIQLGLGQFSLEGDTKHSNTSFTLPILYHPTNWLGFEFRPAWTTINGNSIADYDVSIITGWDYVSLKLGYRAIQSPNETLDGPYIGLSIRF